MLLHYPLYFCISKIFLKYFFIFFYISN
jgi:hypothetical protein